MPRRYHLRMAPRSIARAIAFLLAAACGAAAAAGPVVSSAPPIKNSAELGDYLARVAPGESPLDHLSPPARHRFLTSFRESRPSTADIAAELTREEARAVLALFGYEAFVPRQLRMKRLAIGATETHEATARFDAIDRAASGPDARSAVAAEYRRAFAPLQTGSTLRRLSDGDVALSFRATQKLVEVDQGAPVDDLVLDLAELERRGVAAPAWITETYHAFVVRRDFERAHAFRARHESASLPALPEIRDESSGDGPTVLAQSGDGALVRRTITLDPHAQVVVVAGCHLSKDAAEAIESDAALRSLFSRNTIWITPASEDPADPDIARWNRAHPLAAMSTVYRESEWPAIDSWNMPTFYFLLDGRVAAKVVGWQGHRDAVLAGFHGIGLAP
jgi:hypothetical protein